MKRWTGAMLACVFGMAACGHATVFYQDRDGGVLILEGSENKAMQDAHAKMAAHCGTGGYEIVRREMVTVGTEAYAHQQTDYGEREQRATDTAARSDRRGFVAQQDEDSVRQGSAVTSEVSGVRDLRETRVTYECR